MKKILIDTNSINGRRSALIEGDKLIDFDLEFEGNNFQKGSIHKGKITKIEGSLEAIFVEMGSSRHGFLPFKELSAEYFDPSKTGEDRFKISEGDDIVVQIQKEERVNKGAALSTYISLAFDNLSSALSTMFTRSPLYNVPMVMGWEQEECS